MRKLQEDSSRQHQAAMSKLQEDSSR